MNKIKASKSEIKDNYYIISSGYCSMQYLLRYESPVAYSSGVYGWSCDYYDINGVVISTGYSPINSKNTNASYELIKKYELKASKIENDYTTDYKVRQKKIKRLLLKLIQESKEV